MTSRVEYLQRVPLLRDLEERELAGVAARSREEVFLPGTDIVEIGEPGDRLYIILGGSAQVLYPGGSGEFELARLGPGDFFGEMALLNDSPRSATVRAVKPVRSLVLERDDFRELVADAPGLALKLLEVLSTRIRSADHTIGELDHEILRDPLTDLMNRRAFHDRLAEEVDRTRRYGDSFSLILIDLDRFKSINDTFGHDVGDRVLRWVGRLFGEQTRTADTPFRIGGEEFAILAPSTPGPEARKVAQRIIGSVSRAAAPVDGEIRVTASAGYAACPDDASDSEGIFRVADRALLRAKKEGRDRVATPRAI